LRWFTAVLVVVVSIVAAAQPPSLLRDIVATRRSDLTGRADWRRGCITAPSGSQGDTAARSEAMQISRIPRPVVSRDPAVGVCDPGPSCPGSRGRASLSGRGCTPGRNVLVPTSGGRAGARSLRPPRPIGCVNHQDLEIAVAYLWPQARSQGYFEGWSLVEREGEAHVGLTELALPHPQDGRRFGRISPHVPSALERRDSTRTALGVLGRPRRGLRRWPNVQPGPFSLTSRNWHNDKTRSLGV